MDNAPRSSPKGENAMPIPKKDRLPVDLSESKGERYVFFQHRDGVSLSLKTYESEDPHPLLQEYAALLEEVAKLPGYGCRDLDNDDEYGRGFRRGASVGRRGNRR
jgi:hypothetical protein